MSSLTPIRSLYIVSFFPILDSVLFVLRLEIFLNHRQKYDFIHKREQLERLTSVKLHVSIGKYWVSLYVLACMVVCIMERIGMYWHGMYYGMYWYVLFLVCITCIGKYWYVFRGHMCKYSYVLVSIGMYRKMVCIVHTGKYCYVFVYIDLY